ncbi:MAG: hypothetical protein AAFQ63_21445 [Cyanobacteria bacterium J06621_11]
MALVTTQPINAIVAHIMQEKQGEYGLYQSVLFESSALKNGKLWWALKPAEVQQLRKGQAVELTPTKTRKGKDSWNIRPLDNAAIYSSQQTQPSNTPKSELGVQAAAEASLQSSENRRKQIEEFVFSMAGLHAVCYQAAEQAYSGQNAPDDVIRAATSSLFIVAERRFRLCSPGS